MRQQFFAAMSIEQASLLPPAQAPLVELHRNEVSRAFRLFVGTVQSESDFLLNLAGFTHGSLGKTHEDVTRSYGVPYGRVPPLPWPQVLLIEPRNHTCLTQLIVELLRGRLVFRSMANGRL